MKNIKDEGIVQGAKKLSKEALAEKRLTEAKKNSNKINIAIQKYGADR